MSSWTYVRNDSRLANTLERLGGQSNIEAFAFHGEPNGTAGHVAVTADVIEHWRIPPACLHQLETYRAAGARILCIAFPPSRPSSMFLNQPSSWSIITDQGFTNHNIDPACDRIMKLLQEGGKIMMIEYPKDPPRWVAFPPYEGSWSIICTSGRIINRNLPVECDLQMKQCREEGDPPLAVAFPNDGDDALGRNRWTIVTGQRTFSRNLPPFCEDLLMSMRNRHDLPVHMITFAPGNRYSRPSLGGGETTSRRGAERWAVVSNNQLPQPPFQPSVHGFRFKNPNVPVTICRPYTLEKLTEGIRRCLNIGTLTLTRNMSVCGGMAHSVKEHYLHRMKIPTESTSPTNERDPMFKHLFEVQLETLGGRRSEGFMPLRWALFFWEWHSKHNDRTLQRLTWREFEDLRARLDRGELVLLGLIYAHARDLWDNHQVLAYGWNQSGTAITIKLYDSNDPRSDDNKLSFSTTTLGNITQHFKDGRSHKVRGFFVMEPHLKWVIVPLFGGLMPMNSIPVKRPPVNL